MIGEPDGEAEPGGAGGFTLVELVIAVIILTLAILGIGATATRMLDLSGDAEARTLALQAADDRIQEVQLDPRYAALDSLYEGTEDGLPGLDGFRRVTDVELVRRTLDGGSPVEYKVVAVTVEGPTLSRPVRRTMVVGDE